MNKLPILYIKPSCPWCVSALDYFKAKGVRLDIRDVIASPAEMKQMMKVSGQTKCPTFQHGDAVKADFSVDEFTDWAKSKPRVCTEIGLKL
jgi:glutaredoxin 3